MAVQHEHSEPHSSLRVFDLCKLTQHSHARTFSHTTPQRTDDWQDVGRASRCSLGWVENLGVEARPDAFGLAVVAGSRPDRIAVVIGRVGAVEERVRGLPCCVYVEVHELSNTNTNTNTKAAPH